MRSAGQIRFLVNEQQRGAGGFHRVLDLGVLLGGERRVQRRAGGNVAGLEHRFSGGEALRRIGVHQRQRADGGGKLAAHAVVGAHFGQVSGGRGDRLAGQRVERLVALHDEQRLVVRVHGELALVHRLQDNPGARMAGGGNKGNGINRVGKLVGLKLFNGGVERLRARCGCQGGGEKRQRTAQGHQEGSHEQSDPWNA